MVFGHPFLILGVLLTGFGGLGGDSRWFFICFGGALSVSHWFFGGF